MVGNHSQMDPLCASSALDSRDRVVAAAKIERDD